MEPIKTGRLIRALRMEQGLTQRQLAQYLHVGDKAVSCGEHIVIIQCIANPMPILKKCDLFVLSSLYEGLGLVLLEADTLGIPVISTDVPGPRGFLKQHGGYLVPPDAEGICEGLRAFDEGRIKAMNVDYEEYNRGSVRQFENLF